MQLLKIIIEVPKQQVCIWHEILPMELWRRFHIHSELENN